MEGSTDGEAGEEEQMRTRWRRRREKIVRGDKKEEVNGRRDERMRKVEEREGSEKEGMSEGKREERLD